MEDRSQFTRMLRRHAMYARLIVALHLSGVGAFMLAGSASSMAAYFAGVATFFLCPLLSAWLMSTGRLEGYDGLALAIFTSLIQFLEILVIIQLGP